MPKRTRAHERAGRYIRTLAARHTPGDRLPPIAKMASTASVSVVTMWKAVRELTNEGILQAAPRKGILVAVRSPGTSLREHSGNAPVPRTKWQALCRDIRRDLLNGDLSHTMPLPSVKALCHRYDVCHHTVRKALRRLTDDGWLIARRRSHYVKLPQRLPHRTRIVLIARGAAHREEVKAVSPRTETVLSTLGNECLQRGYELETITCDETATGFRPSQRWDALCRGHDAGVPSVLGFIVITTSIDTLTGLGTIARRIERFGVPAAFFNPSNRDVSRIRPLRRFRVFTIASDESAGEEMGRTLLQLGHRNIAFVSIAHTEEWSQRRLQGTSQALSLSGVETRLSTAVRHDSWKEYFNLPAQGAHRRHVAAMQETIRRCTESCRQTLAQAAADTIEACDRFDTQARIMSRICPVLDSLIEQHDTTAWVAANDIMALHCLDYLRQKRAQDRIAVFGFDNTVAAARRRISSYDFSAPAAVRNMVHFLLAPSTPLFRAHLNQAVDVDGRVVVRHSFRPACGSKPSPR